MRTFALEPLAAHLRRLHPRVDWTDAEVSRHLGITRETLRRWRLYGVPVYDADVAAISLGVHPCRLWPDWFRLDDPTPVGIG